MRIKPRPQATRTKLVNFVGTAAVLIVLELCELTDRETYSSQ